MTSTLKSVRIARENAQLNRVAPLVECLHARGLAAERVVARAPFDLVFANILLEPLRRLARPMRPLLAPGATVILSGLLATQENAALAAYRPHGLSLVRRVPLGEWVTLVLANTAWPGSPQPFRCRFRQRFGTRAISNASITVRV